MTYLASGLKLNYAVIGCGVVSVWPATGAFCFVVHYVAAAPGMRRWLPYAHLSPHGLSNGRPACIAWPARDRGGVRLAGAAVAGALARFVVVRAIL